MARTEREQFGKIGEQWVVQQLRQRGYAAEWIGECSDYDILLEGAARVEVKSAFVSPGSNGGGRWQFSLRRHGLVVDEELLFLLCYDNLDDPPSCVFVIPGEAVGMISKIDITSSDPYKYRGLWARWRNAWQQVERAVAGLSARQPVLFRAEAEGDIPF